MRPPVPETLIEKPQIRGPDNPRSALMEEKVKVHIPKVFGTDLIVFSTSREDKGQKINIFFSGFFPLEQLSLSQQACHG